MIVSALTDLYLRHFEMLACTGGIRCYSFPEIGSKREIWGSGGSDCEGRCLLGCEAM